MSYGIFHRFHRLAHDHRSRRRSHYPRRMFEAAKCRPHSSKRIRSGHKFDCKPYNRPHRMHLYNPFVDHKRNCSGCKFHSRGISTTTKIITKLIQTTVNHILFLLDMVHCCNWLRRFDRNNRFAHRKRSPFLCIDHLCTGTRFQCMGEKYRLKTMHYR